jgi:hypothetical protein
MRVKLDGSSYFTTDVPPAGAAFATCLLLFVLEEEAFA